MRTESFTRLRHLTHLQLLTVWPSRDGKRRVVYRRHQRVWSVACLPRQLRAALGFELAALSPRAVNLACRVAAGKRDDRWNEREYKRTDCGDDLQHDNDSDDDRDHDEDCSHALDYRTHLDRAITRVRRAQAARELSPRTRLILGCVTGAKRSPLRYVLRVERARLALGASAAVSDRAHRVIRGALRCPV